MLDTPGGPEGCNIQSYSPAKAGQPGRHQEPRQVARRRTSALAGPLQAVRGEGGTEANANQMAQGKKSDTMDRVIQEVKKAMADYEKQFGPAK